MIIIMVNPEYRSWFDTIDYGFSHNNMYRAYVWTHTVIGYQSIGYITVHSREVNYSLILCMSLNALCMWMVVVIIIRYLPRPLRVPLLGPRVVACHW